MSQLVVPHVAAQAMLAILAGSTEDKGKSGLFSNNLLPGPNTKFTDVVEPTFAGYAQSVNAWSTPPNPTRNGVDVITRGFILRFTATGVGLPADVYGFFWVSTSTSKLLAAARLDAPPFTFGVALAELQFVVTLGLASVSADAPGSELCVDNFTNCLYGVILLSGTGAP